jgi:hypothetical protein
MNKFKLAVIALLVLFSLSAAGCLFSIVYMSLQDLSRQTAQSQQAAFQLQEKEFRKLGEEHEAWKNLPRQMQIFRSRYIINMDGFAVFRRELNSCLAANQLRAASITFQFGSSLNKLRRVVIAFSLSGSYRDLKKFIYDMERKQKMYFFRSIDLTGGGTAVSGAFNMEAYLGE